MTSSGSCKHKPKEAHQFEKLRGLLLVDWGNGQALVVLSTKGTSPSKLTHAAMKKAVARCVWVLHVL